MAEKISLVKGEKISLAKGDFINLSKMPAIDLAKGGSGLSKVVVGLGWDPANARQAKNAKGIKGFFKSLRYDTDVIQDIDCDAFAILLHDGKMRKEKDLIYFGNLGDRYDSIYHTGDNLTGEGDGDDEQIVVDLATVDADEIVIGVNIYQGRSRHQDFGMLENAFVRIVDMKTNVELCKYDLDDSFSSYVTVCFGKLVKRNGDWTFEAVGQPSNAGSIGSFADEYRR